MVMNDKERTVHALPAHHYMHVSRWITMTVVKLVYFLLTYFQRPHVLLGCKLYWSTPFVSQVENLNKRLTQAYNCQSSGFTNYLSSSSLSP